MIVGHRDGFVWLFIRNSDGTLQSGNKIKANGVEIGNATSDPVNNSSPVVVDWNEDGLLDLVVAFYEPEDGIRVYLNEGTETTYKFSSFSLLQSGSGNIGHSSNQIAVKDLNYDGKKDLIVGEIFGGMNYYENVGTNSEPRFETGSKLKDKNSVIIKGDVTTTPSFTDWNGDGGLDLIFAGHDQSNIHIYHGKVPPVAVKDSIKSSIKKITLGIKVIKGALYSDFFLRFGMNNVSIKFYTVDGKNIITKEIGNLGAGKHTINVKLGVCPSGIYFIKLFSNNICYGQQKIHLTK